jgi:hypothetical protein
VRKTIPALEPYACDRSAAASLNELPAGTIIATDAPWLVAMETPKRSIWLPQDRRAWQRCREALPSLTAVYLTPGFLRWSRDQRPALWGDLFASGDVFGELEIPSTFSDGSRLWRAQSP